MDFIFLPKAVVEFFELNGIDLETLTPSGVEDKVSKFDYKHACNVARKMSACMAIQGLEITPVQTDYYEGGISKIDLEDCQRDYNVLEYEDRASLKELIGNCSTVITCDNLLIIYEAMPQKGNLARKILQSSARTMTTRELICSDGFKNYLAA